MTARDLCFTPAVELSKLYRSRRASPLEVMQAVLARIDAVNPDVNAIVTLVREEALRHARRATAAFRRGAALPPLLGVPVAIKDVTPTKGIRTTHGSKLFESHVPDEDALVVQRLRAAGAIVIGKTNTPEFAFGPNTVNAVFGATHNPWNLALTAGGSSGGSAAALATGMCPLAEGTDLGGSLRGPASYCGVVGFRTTPGLIPRYPSGLAWDTYSVEGPMARTIADTALMLSVMAGADDRSPISYEVDPRELVQATKMPSVKGWRVAWTSDLGGLMTIDDEVRGVFESAISACRSGGARVEDASPDLGDVPEIVRLTRGLLMVARHADKLAEHRDRERHNYRATVQRRREAARRARLLFAFELTQPHFNARSVLQRVREFLETRDLLITPTSATPPFPIGEPHPVEINGRPVGRMLQRSYLTYAFSVLGLPAISIPCGFTRQGLPVGLQIVGRRRGEAAVLRAAAAFEVARPWAAHVPPIVQRSR